MSGNPRESECRSHARRSPSSYRGPALESVPKGGEIDPTIHRGCIRDGSLGILGKMAVLIKLGDRTPRDDPADQATPGRRRRRGTPSGRGASDDLVGEVATRDTDAYNRPRIDRSPRP